MARNKIIGVLVILLVVVLAVGGFVAYTGFDFLALGSSENKVKETFGENCSIQERCGDMLYVDCNSAADGPAYYVREKTFEILAKAGGFCMMAGQCSGPPQEWVQCTAQKMKNSRKDFQ